MAITEAEIDNWFTYHPPDEVQRIKYELIREQARHFAKFIMRTVPDCADRTHCLRVLRDCVMWANAAIACNPGESTDEPLSIEAISRLVGRSMTEKEK